MQLKKRDSRETGNKGYTRREKKKITKEKKNKKKNKAKRE